MNEAIGGSALTRNGSRIVADSACQPTLPDIADALKRCHVHSRVETCRLSRQADLEILSTSAVLLVGTRTSDGAPSTIAMEQIRRIDPRLAVYVCIPSQVALTGGLRSCEFVRSGADDVVALDGRGEFDRLAQLIDARLRAPSPERELRLMAEALPRGLESEVALHCIRNAFRRERDADVAKRFAVSVQTINARLRSSSEPPMGLWMRAGLQFHDRELGRRGLQSRAEVARRLNAESPSALRAQFRRAVRVLRAMGPRGRRLLLLLDPNAEQE